MNRVAPGLQPGYSDPAGPWVLARHRTHPVGIRVPEPQFPAKTPAGRGRGHVAPLAAAGGQPDFPSASGFSRALFASGALVSSGAPDCWNGTPLQCARRTREQVLYLLPPAVPAEAAATVMCGYPMGGGLASAPYRLGGLLPGLSHRRGAPRPAARPARSSRA